MAIINVTDLTFAYDGSYDNVFENVSFRIDTDWKLGLIGRNGRGKTTFLQLLMNKYEYAGLISSSVNFEYFPYDAGDGADNASDLLARMAPDVPEWMINRELSLLGLDGDALYRPFFTLSEGERTKIKLAALFLKENNYPLIDEPTNHLDINARKAVCGYLNSKKGFILVSHDRMVLDNCVDHILSINRADIEVQKGNFSSWFVNRQRQDSYELSENESLQKDIKKMTAAAKRAASWSDKLEKTKYATKNSGLRPDRGYIGHKSAKMMKRSKAIETRRQTAIEEKSKLLKNSESDESLKITPLSFHSDRLLTLEGVSVFYGEKAVCRGIGFDVRQGDRIALLGKNGSGKSSLLKLVCGSGLSYSGNLIRPNALKISYVSQDTSFLSGRLSEFAAQSGIDESLFKAILRKLNFSRSQFDKDMSDFSEGQKKKVLIARSLCERAHLYVWDEPLNYIDVLSRIQIEELILSYRPTMLFVEHDAAFSEKISTKTVELG